MPIGLSDQDSAVAGVTEAGQYRWLKCVDDPSGAGVLQTFQNGVPELSDNGASPVEFRGTYTDYESEVTDISSGSPKTALAVPDGQRAKAIKRVVAEFQTADPTNVFKVYVERTVGASTRAFTLFSLADTGKTDFFVEGHALVMPGETVKVEYDGPVGNDLWFVVTFLDV